MEKQYNIGVTLSGGGIRCIYHAGCLKALEEHGMSPDIIAGSSSGAIIGALYADGYSPDEINEICNCTNFTSWIRLKVFSSGIFDITPFERFLRSLLHTTRLEDLPTPLRIVATDLDHGRLHVFTEGDLVSCLIASCSFPVLFGPRMVDSINYVDGGVFGLFPARVIRGECKYLIGSNCSPLVLGGYKLNIGSILMRVYNFLICSNMVDDREMCDMLIETSILDKFPTFRKRKISALYTIGYCCTNMHIKDTKKNIYVH